MRYFSVEIIDINVGGGILGCRVGNFKRDFSISLILKKLPKGINYIELLTNIWACRWGTLFWLFIQLALAKA